MLSLITIMHGSRKFFRGWGGYGYLSLLGRYEAYIFGNSIMLRNLILQGLGGGGGSRPPDPSLHHTTMNHFKNEVWGRESNNKYLYMHDLIHGSH